MAICLYYKGFWENIENRREFFDWAFKKLELLSMEDWYKVKLRQLEELGIGNMLTKQYSSSLIKALLHIYPGFQMDL